ncbi:hypothetical protein [Pseudoalteromonas sp. GB56]
MNKLTFTLSLSMIVMLSGCSGTNAWFSDEDEMRQYVISQNEQANQQVQVIGASASNTSGTDVNVYQTMASPIQVHGQRELNTSRSVKNVNHYVQALMQDMISNID